MVIFPNAKINLGLHIIRKRADGYHELETVFYPLNITDALEIIVNRDSPSVDVQFSSGGLAVSVTEENNLCIKAYRELKKDFPELPPVKIHLHKAIPAGAGLGGGSADGAFALLLLNQKFQLNLTTEQLLEYALRLGSDCPFFVINKPCLARGRGELLQPVSVGLSEYKFLIVNPGVHIDTAWAFGLIQPATPARSIAEIIQEPIESWKENLANDFEQPLSQFYSSFRFIKETLYELGAVYASMSGSGSTFYGIFPLSYDIPQYEWPYQYFVREVGAGAEFWGRANNKKDFSYDN